MLVPGGLRHTPGWIGEFRAFIMRGNVLDLAIGIVVGAAFTSIVNSLVRDLITPLLGLLIGGIDFSNLFVTLKGAHESTLEAAQRAGAVTLNFGLFLNACITFLIISFAVFWVVKAVARFAPKADEVAKLTTSETTLLEIRDLLARDRL